MICVTEDFLQGNADVYMQLGSRRFPPASGWHFGSRFPATLGVWPSTTFFRMPC